MGPSVCSPLLACAEILGLLGDGETSALGRPRDGDAVDGDRRAEEGLMRARDLDKPANVGALVAALFAGAMGAFIAALILVRREVLAVGSVRIGGR